MAITKEQWAKIQERLKSSFATMQFIVGEHTISVERRSVSESKTALAVFVDGKIEWKNAFDSDGGRPDIITKVWRRRSKAIFPPAKKAKLLKNFGKRKAKEYFPKMDEVMESYDPFFNTAASLVRQFKKIEGIELSEKIQAKLAALEALEI